MQVITIYLHNYAAQSLLKTKRKHATSHPSHHLVSELESFMQCSNVTPQIRLSRTYCVQSVASFPTSHCHRQGLSSPPSNHCDLATRVFQRCWSSGCTLHPQSHKIELVESLPTVLDSHNCRGIIILACLTSVAHQLYSALQVSCFFGCQPCSVSPLLSSPACR